MSDIMLKDIDKRIWEEELGDFVPDKLYDTHTHVYDWRIDSQVVRNLSEPPSGAWSQWSISNWHILEAVDSVLLPQREVHRFLMGNPLQDCAIEQANSFYCVTS